MAKKKRKKQSKGAAFLWKTLFLSMAIGFISLFALIFLVRKDVFGKLPSTEELAGLRNEEATLIFSSNGSVIGKVFAQNRTNVLFQDLPKHVVEALISTEDQRFFEHSGVDAFSYMRVLFRTIIARDRSGGGGSTISQQLIKNLYGREKHGPLTVPVNKIKEALVAQRLEKVYSKEDVITLYLNSVPFGENLYGIEAAAERYFSKSAAKLKVEEGAVLVGMLKANTGYNPRLHPEASKGRRDQVLALMAGNGKLTPKARDSLQALPLRIRYAGVDALDAYGYFDAQVVRQSRAILTELGRKNGTAYDIEKDGLRIHTTLDTALQHAALRSVSKQLSAMQPKLDRELRAGNVRKGWEKKMGKQASADWRQNERSVKEVFRWAGKRLDTLSYRDSLWHYHSMLQAAFLMVDPATGKVRAYSGGNDFRTLPFDQVQSHRPIASAIKPIIYAAGLERGLEPCTYLNNERKTYDELEGWSPQNFDQDTIGGQVALWYALAHSMNIPTVDLYFRTGVDTIRDTFKALGLPVDGVDNPALALGAADVSLQEIVRAYSVFANEGLTRDLQMIERITDARGKVIYQGRMAPATRALDQEVAETVTAMLRRAVDEGTGASMRSRFGVRAALAGKTGTSQDYGDAWFLCYTPGLVAGAWVGARDPEVHFNSALGTGARLALPIIGRTLAAAERSPTMRKQYLRSFPEEITEVDMGCAPRREGNLIERFLDVIFRKDTRTEQDTVKKEKERKGFFRRWFPKKGG
ncbi:MAG: transglycosylase domain-containing protein [Flavobacteriales bacterium]|jgi:penicillin-binding protein 1A|nr:transglycosylase domain-containing protein [Flavobacteriales bacterium]